MPRASLSSSIVCHNRVIARILLLGEVMPTCSRCAKKRVVYVIIVSLTGRQPLLYTKYIKANIHSLCDVRSASDAEYTLLISLCNLLVPCSICCKVLCLDTC